MGAAYEAHERRRYILASILTGWAHTQNNPLLSAAMQREYNRLL